MPPGWVRFGSRAGANFVYLKAPPPTLLPGGASDTDPNRPKKEGQVLLPVDIMDPLAVWLASDQSDGANGCRFVGKLWNPDLPPSEAANGAREEPIFADQVEPQLS